MPTSKEAIIIGHQLNDRNDFAHFDLMENFKKIEPQVLCLYLISLLMILLFYLMINVISNAIRPLVQRRNKVKLSESLASIARDFGLRKLSSIALFLLFVKLFLWFSRLVVSNNYKTSKVVSTLISDH